MEFPPPSVLAHVVDVHCHPTDTEIPDGFPEDLHITICAMSAQTRDQPLVRELTAKCPEKVIPAFGGCGRILAVKIPASSHGHKINRVSSLVGTPDRPHQARVETETLRVDSTIFITIRGRSRSI
jgi:hypothetical protein